MLLVRRAMRMGEGDLGRVVIHQDDVGGLNGGVRTQSTHGDAHIRTGKDRGVVNTVAHEGQHLFGVLGSQELLDLVHLIAGQQAGVGTRRCPALPRQPLPPALRRR